MVAGKNSVPLEKTLLQMDLSRGLDESVRPEIGNDQAKLLTTLENLVQDKDGAWTLRPGVGVQISNSTDDTGGAVGNLDRLYQTKNGLLASNEDYRLFQAQEALGKFVRKGRVSEFSLEAFPVATSQQVTHSTTTTYASVLAIGSTNSYLAVIYENGWNNGSGYGATVVIFDKFSKTQIARYSLAPVAATLNTVRPIYMMTFVGGDSGELHIYTHNQNGGPIYFTNISTTWPVSGTTVSFSATSIAAATNLYDVAAYSGALGDYSVAVCGTAGAICYTTLGVPLATRAGNWHSVDIDNNGVCWLMGKDAGTTRLQVVGVPVNAIGGAATYSWIDPTVVPTFVIGACSSTGVLSIIDATNPAFGTSTIPALTLYTTASAASTSVTNRGTIYGWAAASKPFYLDSNGKPYVHLNKSSLLSTVPDLTTHVLACLDTGDITQQFYSSVNSSIGWRVAAVLEPFNGARATAQPRPVQTITGSNLYSTDIVIPYLLTARGTSMAWYRLSLSEPKSNNSVMFGGSTYISGGTVTAYDGARASELGVLDEPLLTTQFFAGPLTGSYNYVSIFRYVDAQGNAAMSKVYGPISVTPAAQQVFFTIQEPHLTNKEIGLNGDFQIVVELYRTVSGGTQYFLVGTTQVGNSPGISYAGGFYQFADTVTDATLQTKPLLYRQPGTLGTALDRCPPPGNYGVICAHKDRLFIASPFGNKVFYSSFFVDGEQPWFNAQLSFLVHGGSGPITGMTSMDGRLIIFKRDAVFIVDGDGPPENGGSGAEFSPPARLSLDIGCIDHRSIVVTSSGVMYRSSRGIELLSRSLQTSFIGERVVDTVNANPSTRAAVMHEGRVYYCLSVDDTATSAGTVVVYDIVQDCWSTQRFTFQSTYGRNVRGAAVWEVNDNNDIRLGLICGSGSTLGYLSTQTYDGNSQDPIPWTIESGWIRPGGNMARFRVHDIMFLGKRNADNSLTVSTAYDYESYSQSRKWDQSSLKSTLVDVTLQPKNTQPVTFKVKVTSPGYGYDVLGLCFLISPKAGAKQVAEFKKG